MLNPHYTRLQSPPFPPQVAKCVPRILLGFQLNEVTTRQHVTRMVADRIRQNRDVKNKVRSCAVRRPRRALRKRVGNIETKGSLPKLLSSPFCPPFSPQEAIDTLILRGRIELEEAMQGFVQRHHIITTYIRGPQAEARAREKAAFIGAGRSDFLAGFLKSKGA